MTIREKFVERFGEEQAKAIETAAESHGNGINNAEIGDHFKWCLLICIGYQCFEVISYREAHNITPPFEDIKEWIKGNAELHTYHGNLDYLALMVGKYEEYLPKEVTQDLRILHRCLEWLDTNLSKWFK